LFTSFRISIIVNLGKNLTDAFVARSGYLQFNASSSQFDTSL